MNVITLEMTAGEEFPIDLVVTNKDGSAYTKTGSELTLTAKRSVADADADAVFSHTVGVPSGGAVTVVVLPVDTSGITEVAVLAWDAWLKETGNHLFNTDVGLLIVRPPVKQTH